MTTVLADRNINCPILSGNVRTEHNHLLWSGEPELTYIPFSYRIT
jgi:hypothetical protein